MPDTTILPEILAANGWAPALHLGPTQAFWGDELSLAPKPTAGTCGVMSIAQLEHGLFSKRRDKYKHPTIVAMAREEDIIDTTVEGYMAQTMRIPYEDDIEPIPTITGKAPTTISVYIDGSVQYPSHRYAPIGTYAAYHKIDNTQQQLTDNEAWTSFECEFGHECIKLYGPLKGAFPSSNRAEAAGTLLVLFRPTPLHLGVNNSLAASIF